MYFTQDSMLRPFSQWVNTQSEYLIYFWPHLFSRVICAKSYVMIHFFGRVPANRPIFIYSVFFFSQSHLLVMVQSYLRKKGICTLVIFSNLDSNVTRNVHLFKLAQSCMCMYICLNWHNQLHYQDYNILSGPLLTNLLTFISIHYQVNKVVW